VAHSEKFSETEPYSISDLFDKSTIITVPRFQRDYSWNTENNPKFNQIPDLWNDIAGKYSEFKQTSKDIDLEYLLGPMIFIKRDRGHYEIVDGQQRLSTLTMFLCIVRDILHEFCMDNPDPNNTKDWKPSEEIYKWIENFEYFDYDELAPLSDIKNSHKSWKLIMNKNDEKIFEEYIQKYKADSNDKFTNNDQDTFRRISKKIVFMKNKIKEDDDLPDSHKKIFEAYSYLYKKINETLVTGFEFNIEYGEKNIQIKNDYEKKVLEELHENPTKWGFNSDFFSDPLNGYDVLVSKDWDTDQKSLKEKEWETNMIKKESDKKLSFENWIEKEKEKKLKEKKSNEKSLKEYLEDPDEIEKCEYEIKMNNLGMLKRFTKQIFTKFFNVRLEVDEDDDAFQIFETVNFRGQTLSKTNLIKNWILRNIPGDDEDKYAQLWDDHLAKIKDSDKDKFFTYSIRSRGDYDEKSEKRIFSSYKIPNLPGRSKLNKDNVYKIIKRPFLECTSKYTTDKPKADRINEKTAKSFIDDQLKNDTAIFSLLKDPESPGDLFSEKNFKELKSCLNDLVNLDAEYVHMILMTAYRKWGDSDSFIVLTKFLTMFFIRFKTLGTGKPAELENLMIKTCDIIENQDSSKDTLVQIIKIVLTNETESDFKNNLMNKKIKDKTGKFILEHIMDFLSSQDDDMIPHPVLELEHILPKNPKSTKDNDEKGWDKEKFFDTKNYDDKEYPFGKEFSEWHERLGNLTLLSKPINIKVRNYNFPTKLDNDEEGYNKSSLQLNKLTVVRKPASTNPIDWTNPPKIEDWEEREDWYASDIIERTRWFYEISSLIWKLPSIICSNSQCENHHKHSRPTEKLLDGTDEWKCDVCDSSFTVKWSDTVGLAYRLPKNFTFT